MDQISAASSRVISGNHTVTNISVNRGTLRVTGNHCRITVMLNFGAILYSGDQGYINIIGASNELNTKCTDKSEGKIITTCRKLQLHVGSSCHAQVLRFVGTEGVLHLAHSERGLHGCLNLRIKEGRVRTLKQRAVALKVAPDLLVVPADCRLQVRGCHGLSVRVHQLGQLGGAGHTART